MSTPPRRHSKSGKKQREDAAEALEAAEAPKTPPTAPLPAAYPAEPEGALSDVVNSSPLKRRKGGRKQREADQPQETALAGPFHGGRGSPDASPGDNRPQSSSAAAGAEAAADVWTHREAATFEWGSPGESPSEGAHRLIADRLLMPSSAAAQAMHVRPQLQVRGHPHPKCPGRMDPCCEACPLTQLYISLTRWMTAAAAFHGWHDGAAH